MADTICRFFFVLLTDENLKQIFEVCQGSLDCIKVQRTSLDGTTIMVKLQEGDENNYPFLPDEEYNENTVGVILDTPAWTSDSPNV
jgi:hypothetical protein